MRTSKLSEANAEVASGDTIHRPTTQGGSETPPSPGGEAKKPQNVPDSAPQHGGAIFMFVYLALLVLLQRGSAAQGGVTRAQDEGDRVGFSQTFVQVLEILLKHCRIGFRVRPILMVRSRAWGLRPAPVPLCSPRAQRLVGAQSVHIWGIKRWSRSVLGKCSQKRVWRPLVGRCRAAMGVASLNPEPRNPQPHLATPHPDFSPLTCAPLAHNRLGTTRLGMRFFRLVFDWKAFYSLNVHFK